MPVQLINHEQQLDSGRELLLMFDQVSRLGKKGPTSLDFLQYPRKSRDVQLQMAWPQQQAMLATSASLLRLMRDFLSMICNDHPVSFALMPPYRAALHSTEGISWEMSSRTFAKQEMPFPRSG